MRWILLLLLFLPGNGTDQTASPFSHIERLTKEWERLDRELQVITAALRGAYVREDHYLQGLLQGREYPHLKTMTTEEGTFLMRGRWSGGEFHPMMMDSAVVPLTVTELAGLLPIVEEQTRLEEERTDTMKAIRTTRKQMEVVHATH